MHSTPRRFTPKIVGGTDGDDPIFALIVAHNQIHDAALQRSSLENWADETGKACDDENDAFDALLEAAASTLPGLVAKLTYLREIAEGKMRG